jgi:hypothetical protein
MNDNEHPSDSAVTRELRDSLSAVAAPERPSLAVITDRGRVHQRRRLAGLGGLCVTGAATGTALALGLTGVFGAASAGSAEAGSAAPRTGSAGTIRTAAFTLTSNANGTDTLTLTHSQMFDPAALQQALAQHGIAAVVRTDTFCSSSPAAPDPGSLRPGGLGVLSIRAGVEPPRPRAVPAPGSLKPGDLSPRGLRAVDLNRIVDHSVTVINPAKMPSGTELFFGYFNSDHALFFDLIYSSSYTCSTGQQPPATP